MEEYHDHAICRSTAIPMVVLPAGPQDQFDDWGLTFGNPDFVKYAEAYGAKGWRIEETDNLAPTLEAAFGEGGLHLVAVPVDYSENQRVLVEELRNRVPPAAPA